MSDLYINNRKTTLLNIVTSFASQIFYIVYNFLMLPLVAVTYGSAINGIVQTFTQIISYVQLVGAGISESALVKLYEPVRNNDEDKINNILSSCNKLFIRSGFFYIFGIVVISLIYPIFLNEIVSYIDLVLLMIILSVIGACEFFLYGKYRTFLLSSHRLYVVNLVQVITLFIALVLGLVSIYFKANIFLFQLLISSCFIIRALIVFLYCKFNFPFLNNVASSDFILKDRKEVLIHQIASLIMNASQLPLISIFMGGAQASVFAVYILIYSGLSIVIRTLCNSVISKMGYLSNDKEKLEAFFAKYQFISFIIIFVVFNTALILGNSFIFIYTRDISDVDYIVNELNLLFVIMAALNTLKLPGITLISALGHYKQTKSRAVIEMAICLILELILIPLYGLYGAVIACIFAYLYRLFDVLYYISKNILSIRVLYIHYVIVGFSIVAVSYFYIGNVIFTNYYQFIYLGLYYFSISLAIIATIFLSINFILNKVNS